MLRLRSASFYALVVSVGLAGCTDNTPSPQLSSVDIIEIPVADTTTTTNVNIANPTLTQPTSFPVADGDVLTLVWSDEFDGAQLDPETWFFEEGDGSQYGIPGWGNNERQYYLPDNARLEGGRLIIDAKRETVGSYGFTSARITTKDRYAFRYGRFEASMKLPAGQGIWPAFWMLPQDDEQGSAPAKGLYGGFSASGEIDIMEAVNIGGLPGPGGLGGGNTIFGTIHFGGEFPANQSTTVQYEVPESLTDGFNTFAVEWDEAEIRWYANGVLYATQNSWDSANGDFPAPFDQPFKILFNLAVGGNFPGDPDGSTPTLATMEVDWVRVYSGQAPTGGMPSEPTESAMAPTEDPADVTSVFSDEYTDITADYNPSLGQTTVFSPAAIGGDQLLKYANLDFQVIDFAANPQDVSDKGFLHVDVWTADSTELNVSVSSSGQAGDLNPIAVAPNSWVSVDIPITDFGPVDLTDIVGIRFEGNGTIFVDNLYFAGDPPIPASAGEIPDVVIVAADGSTPDLTVTFDGFGSGTTFVTDFAGDYSYDNVVEFTVGAGYGGGALAQLGLTGLTPGFASAYGEFVFKVKGLDADNTILAKLEEPFPGTSIPVEIDLTSPPANVTVTDLGDGWSQVVIDMAAYGDVSTFSQIVFQTLDGAYAVGDDLYLTDIGFNVAQAAPGLMPGTSIIPADGSTPDLVAGTDFTGFEAFGTGGSNDYAFTGDSSFANVVAVTPGAGYGGGSLGQFGIVGFTPGFAAAYDTLLFKVKGLSDNTVVVKLEEPFPGASVPVTIDLASPPAGVTVTDLGDGWSQVEIPISAFGNVSTFSQIVIENVPGSQAEGNPFFVTDLGFTSAGASAGDTPDVSIITVDGSTPDLVAGTDFTGFEAFGTGGSNDYAFTGDSSFANAVAVTPGAGYGGGSLGQFGTVGFTPGFAAAYDTLLFKVKGLSDNTVVVKLEEPFPGASVPVTVDLASPPAGVTATDLGDGWSQVVIPISAFGDVSALSQLVIENVPGSQAEGNPFFVTDLGFTSAGASAGDTPDVSIITVD
ncbi:MAG: glycoside hydrolase family 16 protein, partial [Woeseiaceae bacterium]|nr:glycoside hydrolase family 16 protein [Woeseiaceae bacterium]